MNSKPHEQSAAEPVPAWRRGLSTLLRGSRAPSAPSPDAQMHDALAALRPHERKLLGYILRRHGDPTRADDILQQTLLMVMEQSRKQPILQPVAYAYRVADSLIYAQTRRGRREEALGDDDDYGCDLPIADEILEHKQRAAIFAAGLAALSPLRRDIFVRRHIDGCSRQQIADDLNINLEAVKKHLVRAMVELAGVMDEAGRER